jgi:hypothetical protein
MYRYSHVDANKDRFARIFRLRLLHSGSIPGLRHIPKLAVSTQRQTWGWLTWAICLSVPLKVLHSRQLTSEGAWSGEGNCCEASWKRTSDVHGPEMESDDDKRHYGWSDIQKMVSAGELLDLLSGSILPLRKSVPPNLTMFLRFPFLAFRILSYNSEQFFYNWNYADFAVVVLVNCICLFRALGLGYQVGLEPLSARHFAADKPTLPWYPSYLEKHCSFWITGKFLLLCS